MINDRWSLTANLGGADFRGPCFGCHKDKFWKAGKTYKGEPRFCEKCWKEGNLGKYLSRSKELSEIWIQEVIVLRN